MASFSRKTGIIGALVIAGVLIAGSLIITNGGLAFLNPSRANAASTEALLQAYATRDSDNDGLPDWEEALYGLDPNNPHSFSPNMTDGQAVAEGLVKPKFLTTASSTDAASSTLPDGILADSDSLTEQFSQTLLTQYLNQSAADGGNPSDTEVANLAQSAMQTFAQNEEHQNAFTLGQVQVSGTGPDAMEAYAASAEMMFAQNKPDTDPTIGELGYFSDAIEKNDPTALTKVAEIGKYYTELAPALMQVTVPTEAQNAHLELVNAIARIGADITDLSTMNTDPLRAYLGLAQYQVDTTSFAKSFNDMGAVFSAEGVTIPVGDPGYYFYRFATRNQGVVGNTSSQN